MLGHIELKFCIWLRFTVLQIKFKSLICVNLYTPVFRRDVLWYGDVRPSGSPSVSHSFPHFSPSCFDILSWKFCMSLSSYEHSIKCECRQCPSIFVGVMPFLELRILEIHSFPQFSPTCFDILSWDYAYDFVLLYYRSSSSVVNLRQFL